MRHSYTTDAIMLRVSYCLVVSMLSVFLSQARTWQQRPPYPRVYQTTCLAARQDMNVDMLLDAQGAYSQGLPTSYTGRGVMVGIVDTGIEFGHVNFRHPITGQTRLCGAVLYRQEKGSPDEVREYFSDPLLLDTLTTDTRLNGHGTHTAGVAAGSFGGWKEQGMAPDAELMLCGTSSLTDERLIDAMRITFSRADELGLPCVINLSIGNPVDWKDGLTPFCLACDSLTDWGNAPGRIIVLSAGNDGNKPFSVDHIFRDAEPVFALLQPTTYQKQTAYLNPNIDTYCSDSLPLALDFVLYDTLTHQLSDCPFEQHLLDTLEAGHNGRRHLCLDADTCLLGAYPHQLLAARFVGSRGSAITAYYINCSSVGYAVLPGRDERWMSGTSVHSISDLCCTESVISVGAYSAVDTVVNVFGRHLPAVDAQGQVCAFSSYGETAYGVPKPDVLCPGASVISSFSAFWDDKITYYYTSRRYLDSPMMHVYTPGETDVPWFNPDNPSRTYYWINDTGTSQSSPAMAGIIALWLEACPTLSVRDIRSILQQTSRFDDPCLAAPGGVIQAGSGKADALAGMREVLSRVQGIEAVPQSPSGDFLPAYDLMGRRISSSSASQRPLISRGSIIIVRP